MATQLLTDISNALSQLFAGTMQRQFNRHAVLFSLLRKTPGRGKNVAWDVKFTGTGVRAEAYAEGADVLPAAFTTDTPVPAILPWGQYRSSFEVSGLALSAAAGSTGTPSDLVNLIEGDTRDAASALASLMNADLYSGTGAGNTFVGLQSALAVGNTYATIDKLAQAEWDGNVDANGGVARPLTKALLDDMEQAIYQRSGMAPDVIVCTPAVAKKYESLFDTMTRVINESGEISPLRRNIGAPLIRDRSGYYGLSYKGIPVYRDRNAPSGANGDDLYMLNTEQIEIEFLAQPGVNTSVSASAAALEDDMGDSVGGLARLEYLAKTGDADKFTMKLYPQLKVRRVNCHGLVTDIDPT